MTSLTYAVERVTSLPNAESTKVTFTGAHDSAEWTAWVHFPARTVTVPVAARTERGVPVFSVHTPVATYSSRKLSDLALMLADMHYGM